MNLKTALTQLGWSNELIESVLDQKSETEVQFQYPVDDPTVDVGTFKGAYESSSVDRIVADPYELTAPFGMKS